MAVGPEKGGIQRLGSSGGPSRLVGVVLRLPWELVGYRCRSWPDRVLVDLDRPHVLICVVGDVEGEHHDLLPAELILLEEPLQSLRVVQLDEEPLEHPDVLAAELAE